MSRGGDPAVTASRASPLPVRLDLTYSGFATNRITWLFFKNQGELGWGCASGRAEVKLAGDLMPSTDQQAMSTPLPEAPLPSFAPVSQPWPVPGQTGPLESAQAIRVVCSGALWPSQHLAHGSADSGPGLGPGPCSLHRSALVTLRGCPSSQFGWAQDADPSLPGSVSLRTSRGISHALFPSPPPHPHWLPAAR